MSKTRLAADAPARGTIVSDLERNLIVEAGAGSGKTQKLAERMAAGIATGTYELEQMAAVTFTRKAAAELRGRFQVALEAELRKGGAADRTERIRHALGNLERFFAGTIHAFCARLLRERPVEAGVSPGFTELDDVEEALLRQRSWRDYRSQARARGDVDLLELIDAGMTAKQLDKAFETVCLYEDVTFPPGNQPLPDSGSAWSALETFWITLASLLPSPIDPASKCKTQERAQRFERQWRSFIRGRRDPALLANLLRAWESKPNVTPKWWGKGVGAKVEQLHADFREKTVQPYLTAWRQYLYGRSVSLLTRARDAARDERRSRNSLSFNDLLLMTAHVLRTNAEVRHALQQKYRWLLVDEFQDTDPVQAEIMFLLAAEEDKRSAPSPKPQAPSLLDWRAVALRPGALFVVGDPKQSIYRFRRADIEIYNEVRARLGGDEGRDVLRLTTNFRSVPGLCAWANKVFAGTFPPVPTPQSPMFAPLDAWRDTKRGHPEIAVLDMADVADAEDVAPQEASRIARYIRAEVDAGRHGYGDFLILTRKKKSLRPYATALEALQVPIEVTGAGAFDESEEVREIALLLGALADPQDAVSLVGVLRGTLFGCSDQELFAFRQAGGYFNLFCQIETTDEDAARVASAFASLGRWHDWTRALPAGAALERIFEDSGYLALAATSRGGVEAGDLLHAIDRVRAVVETGFTLAEAADALASWCGLDDDGPGESTEVDSVPLEPGRHDVVRLMNLHKAKGLEASVVFLVDPLGGFDPRVDVRIVREGTEPVGYFQIQEEGSGFGRRVLAEPAGWATHKATEEAYLVAEVSRLMYVAATRAKDTLVVGLWPGRPGNRKPSWTSLSQHLAGMPKLLVPGQISLPLVAATDLSVAAAARAMAVTAAAHEEARQPSWAARSVTAEIKTIPRYRDDVNRTDGRDEGSEAPNRDEGREERDPDNRDDPTRTILPDTASHRADAGQAWGTLLHGLLEHAMRFPAATAADLRRLAMWLTVDEPELRGVLDQAVSTALAVVGSDALTAARRSAECHEEVPFAVQQVRDGLPTVVTGAIDLVYRAGDGWQVVDYKTDADSAKAATNEAYEAQVRAYAEAWGRVTGGNVATRVVSARARPFPA